MAEKETERCYKSVEQQLRRGRGRGMACLMVVDDGNGGRVDVVQLPVVPRCCGREQSGVQEAERDTQVLKDCLALGCGRQMRGVVVGGGLAI